MPEPAERHMQPLLCWCAHSARIHRTDTGACRVGTCECTGFAPTASSLVMAGPAVTTTTPEPPPAAAPEPPLTKRCGRCHEVKPRDAFNARKRPPGGQLQSWCKRCMNDHRPASARTVTLPKLLRTRARHRAAAELQARHAREFAELYETYKAVVATEAELLAGSATAAAHYADAPALTRLRPGPRLPEQSLLDRIDVARCPECVGHHDRGHRCLACGAEPTQEERQVERNDDDRVDGRDVEPDDRMRPGEPRLRQLLRDDAGAEVEGDGQQGLPGGRRPGDQRAGLQGA